MADNENISVNPQDAQDNKLMAILSYLGILVLIPLFAAKESPFARFHTNQGLILMIVEIAYSIIVWVLSIILVIVAPGLAFIVTIFNLVSIALLVLAIIGIINAAKGETKELPLIGKFRLLK
jgi:uncharacterized membrane protein